jgi:hypothetical protein
MECGNERLDCICLADVAGTLVTDFVFMQFVSLYANACGSAFCLQIFPIPSATVRSLCSVRTQHKSLRKTNKQQLNPLRAILFSFEQFVYLSAVPTAACGRFLSP